MGVCTSATGPAPILNDPPMPHAANAEGARAQAPSPPPQGAKWQHAPADAPADAPLAPNVIPTPKDPEALAPLGGGGAGGGPTAPAVAADPVPAAGGDDGGGVAIGGGDALRAVVKVFTTHLYDMYMEPWRKQSQMRSTGTSFAIELADGRRVLMTNAHVVYKATQIRVRRFQDATRYKAETLCLSREMDLALLSVESADFWEGIRVLPFEWTRGCQLQDVVVVFGFPRGGDNLCVTRGVVSRHTLNSRVAYGAPQLTTQIDAAINSGNSGGPALNAAGAVIGVAVAKLTGSDNIGFIIPPVTVKHFLDTFAAIGGAPTMIDDGIIVLPIESDAMRQCLGLSADMEGCLVTRVYRNSALDGKVLPGDVLLSVNGKDVAGDGTILFDEGSGTRLFYTLAIRHRPQDYAHQIEVWRPGPIGISGRTAAGRRVQIATAFRRTPRLVPCIADVDAEPSYFIFGGIVFVTLTMPWLSDTFQGGSLFGPSGPGGPSHLDGLFGMDRDGDESVVVISHVKHHDVNFGYQDQRSGEIVQSANGRKVRSLSDLATIVANTPDDGFLVLHMQEGTEDIGGAVIVLDVNACRAAEEAILAEHTISAPCSDNVKVHDALPPLVGQGQAPSAGDANSVDVSTLLVKAKGASAAP